MQNIISDLYTNLSPQTLGMTDSTSIFGIGLLAPGILMFLGLLAVSMGRPRWRGYWDAV